MGIPTGRQVAPLAAALLLTLTACAQPSAAPAGPSPALPTRPAPLSAAARPTGPASTSPASTGPASTSPASSSATGEAPAIADSTAGVTATAPSTATAPITSGAGQPVSPLPSCRAATLPTSVKGTLTFAVSKAAGAPWIIGDPAQGRGFEAAVGAAVAAQLGYPADRVQWRTAAAGAVQAARVAGTDVGIGEFRTPDQGVGPVDYSTGYFSISDSVVARVGSPAAELTGLSALSKLRVAARSTPSAGAGHLDAPSSTAYPSTAAALEALRRGAVDVAVVPTPAAVTAGPDITVLGQLTQPTEQPAQFGMVLPLHSRLTSCVSAAIDQLRVTGALSALVQRWVPAANKPLR